MDHGPRRPRHSAAALAIAALAVAAGAVPAAAQAPPTVFLHLDVEDGTLVQGATGSFAALLDNPLADVQGWSFSVCHDPGVLTLLDAQPGSATLTVQYGSPPDFHEISFWPNGYAQGVITDVSTGAFLPAGTDLELAVGTYTTSPSGFSAADLCICDTLSPNLDTVIVRFPGISVTPGTGCGSITLPPPPPPPSLPFVRGDANDDGASNIADVIWILIDLFVFGPHTNCDGANDANADGNMDISDALFLLAKHFGSGPAPAQPWPDCGTVMPASECVEFTSCP